MTTKLQFSKMHALGNDFILIDAVCAAIELSPEQLRVELSNRLTLLEQLSWDQVSDKSCGAAMKLSWDI